MLPKLSLNSDGAGVRVLFVGELEGRYVPLICWGRWAEALCDGGAGRLLVSFCGESMVAEPLEEGDPAVCVLQRKGIGQGRPDRTGVGPAQQPSLAVGEDAHAHPALLP